MKSLYARFVLWLIRPALARANLEQKQIALAVDSLVRVGNAELVEQLSRTRRLCNCAGRQ